MCQSNPTRRCPTHAEEALGKAVGVLDATHPVHPDINPLAPTQCACDAQAAADASPVPVDSVFTKRYETVDDKIAAFHAELEAKVAELDTDENWHAYLDTMSAFHNYSFSNQMLIMMQRPDATRVAGFRTWTSLDRHVRKGEKGISILAPKTAWVAAKDEHGAPKLGADGKPLKEKRCVGFTTASVFDVSQTDGKDLPEGITALSETPPEGFTSDLENAIRKRGFTIEYGSTGSPTMRGYTQFATKRVVIADSMSDADKAATLAHELGHIAAGHEERTEEYHTREGGHRGQIEVEAEAIGYVLCRSAGMQTNIDKSGKYVKGWAMRETERDTQVVAKSAEHIAKTVKGLLTTDSWTHLSTGTTTEE